MSCQMTQFLYSHTLPLIQIFFFFFFNCSHVSLKRSAPLTVQYAISSIGQTCLYPLKTSRCVNSCSLPAIARGRNRFLLFISVTWLLSALDAWGGGPVCDIFDTNFFTKSKQESRDKICFSKIKYADDLKCIQAHPVWL